MKIKTDDLVFMNEDGSMTITKEGMEQVRENLDAELIDSPAYSIAQFIDELRRSMAEVLMPKDPAQDA